MSCNPPKSFKDVKALIEALPKTTHFINSKSTPLTPFAESAYHSVFKWTGEDVSSLIGESASKDRGLYSINSEFFKSPTLLQRSLESLGVDAAFAAELVKDFDEYQEAEQKVKSSKNIKGHAWSAPLEGIMGEDNTLPPQISFSMMLISENFLAKHPTNSPFQNDYDRESFLYGAKRTPLSGNEWQELKGLGYGLSSTSKQLGPAIIALMGMGTGSDSYKIYMERLQDALGMYSLLIGANVKNSKYKIEEKKFKFRPNPKPGRIYNNNTSYNHIVINEGTKEKKINNKPKFKIKSKNLGTAIEVLAKGANISNDTDIRYEAAEKVDTRIYGSFGNLPKKMVEIVANLQSKAWGFSSSTSLLSGLAKLDKGEEFLHSLMNVVDVTPERFPIKSYREKIEASNRDKITALDRILEAHGGENKDSDMFFTYQFMISHRLRQKDSLGPQNNKVSRLFIQPKGDTTYTKENIHLFKLAVLYNMGYSIDKNTPVSILGEFDSLLENGDMQEAIALYKAGDLAQMRRSVLRLNGKGAYKGLGILNAVVALAQYPDGGMKDNKAFVSDITLEIDGMTNGFSISTFQFPVFESLEEEDRILAQIGVYKGEGVEHKIGEPDVYINLGEALERFKGYEKYREYHEKRKSPSIMGKKKYERKEVALEYLFPFTDMGLPIRDVVKYPFMISQYSGGVPAIVRGVGSDIIEEVYKKINDLIVKSSLLTNDPDENKIFDNELAALGDSFDTLGMVIRGNENKELSFEDYFKKKFEEETSFDDFTINSEESLAAISEQLLPRFDAGLDSMLGLGKPYREAVIQGGEALHAIFITKLHDLIAEELARINRDLVAENHTPLKVLPNILIRKLVEKEELFELIPQYKGALLAAADDKDVFISLTKQSKVAVKEDEEVDEQEDEYARALTAAEITNHSGGAYGGDTFWDLVGRELGIVNHKHYRDAGNKTLSKQLRKKNIKATVLNKEQMDFARAELKAKLNKTFPNTRNGNLQVRNYYQIANSDGVFAIATIKPDRNKAIVKGGTNTAVELAQGLSKPTYIWDTTSRQWYRAVNGEWVKTDTPILTKNFAGIGTRDIEQYEIQNKDTGKWELKGSSGKAIYLGAEVEAAAKQAIRDAYKKTLNPLGLEEEPIKGINISTKSEDQLGKELTNPNWGAKHIMDIEAEYKRRASIKARPELNPEDALEYDMDLMHELQMKKFRAHPELIQKITDKGGVKFLEASKHVLTNKGRWEGEGSKSNFIKVLIRSYKSSITPKATIPQNLVSGQEQFKILQEATDKVKEKLGANPTSIDMIESGFRTRTTRSRKEMDKYKIQVGDLIEHVGKSSSGKTKTILARVTAIHPQNTKGWKGTWAKEGWTDEGVDEIDNFVAGAAAIEFELVNGIKEGVEELFKENPKLAKIGTEQQYSDYLDTVFSESQVKDIIYHWTTKVFDKFDLKSNKYLTSENVGRFGKGISFAADPSITKPLFKDENGTYPENLKLVSAIVYIENPLTNLPNTRKEVLDAQIKGKHDSVIVGGGKYAEYTINTAEQIHILGSKEDIAGFKYAVESGLVNTGSKKGKDKGIESNPGEIEVNTKNKSFKLKPSQVEFSPPSVSTLTNMVMDMDSSVLYRVLEKFPELLPLYDAIQGQPEVVEGGGKTYNKEFFNLAQDTSILEIMAERIDKAVELATERLGDKGPAFMGRVNDWMTANAFKTDYDTKMGVSFGVANDTVHNRAREIGQKRGGFYNRLNKKGVSIHQMLLLDIKKAEESGTYFSAVLSEAKALSDQLQAMQEGDQEAFKAAKIEAYFREGSPGEKFSELQQKQLKADFAAMGMQETIEYYSNYTVQKAAAFVDMINKAVTTREGSLNTKGYEAIRKVFLEHKSVDNKNVNAVITAALRDDGGNYVSILNDIEHGRSNTYNDLVNNLTKNMEELAIKDFSAQDIVDIEAEAEAKIDDALIAITGKNSYQEAFDLYWAAQEEAGTETSLGSLGNSVMKSIDEATLSTSVTGNTVKKLLDRYKSVSASSYSSKGDMDTHFSHLDDVFKILSNGVDKIGKISLTEHQVKEYTQGKYFTESKKIGMYLSTEPPKSVNGSSPAEVYVHELLHALLFKAIRDNPLLVTQLKRVRNQTKKSFDSHKGKYGKLTPFLEGIDNPSKNDLETAKEQYDYLFGINSNPDTRLDEFLAYAVTNRAVIKYLQGTSTRLPARDSGLLGNLLHLLDVAVDFIARKASSRASNKDSSYLDMMDTVERLIAVQSKNSVKSARYQAKISETLDNTDRSIRNFMSEKIDKFAYSENTSKLKLLITTPLTAGAMYMGDNLKMAKLRHALTKRMSGAMRAILLEYGQGSLTTELESLLLKGNNIHGRARHETELMSIDTSNNRLWKSIKGTDISSKTKIGITNVMFRTSLSNLVQAGIPEQRIAKLLGDVNIIKEEMRAIRKRLNLSDDHMAIKNARELGYNMATGLTKMANAGNNAYSIAQRHLPKRIDEVATDLAAYASLSALVNTDKREKALVAELAANEFATDPKINGFKDLLHIHRFYNENVKTKLFGGDKRPYQFYEGWIVERTDNYHSAVAGRKEESEVRRKEGYSKQIPMGKIEGVEQYNDTLYVSHTIPENPFVSGIIPSTTENNIGTTLTEILSSNPKYQDAEGNANFGLIKAKVKQIIARETKRARSGNENYKTNLRPVTDSENNITDYRVIMSHAMKDQLFRPELEYQDVLAHMESSIIDKESTIKIGIAAINLLVKEQVEMMPQATAKYVDLLDQSSPFYERYTRLPKPVKRYLDTFTVKDTFMVREDIINDVFGYPSPTIVNASWLQGDSKARYRHVAELFQEGLRNTMAFAKDRIVITKPDVVTGNIRSNITNLMIRRISPAYIMNKAREGYLEYKRFREDTDNLRRLKSIINIRNLGKTSDEAVEYFELLSDIKSNKMYKYAEAGLDTLVAEDVNSSSADGIFPLLKRHIKDTKYETALDRVPKTASDAAKWALMTKTSSPYKILHEVVQLSDFLARYVMIEHAVNVKGENFEAAVSEAVAAFVLFDKNLHPFLHTLDVFGLTMFVKYKLRNNKASINSLKKHPTTALTALALEQTTGANFSGNLSSSMLGGVNEVLPMMPAYGNAFDTLTQVPLYSAVTDVL